MFWYKSWLETRSRFLIGLALMVLSTASAVMAYPRVMKLMPMAGTIDASGEIGRRIKEGVELARDYRGYLWSQWIRQALANLGTLFAVLLGTGGLLPRSSGGAPLFTLSLPISRKLVIGSRAATGLVELLAMALIPMLLVPVLSPAVGERYAVTDALVHGACLFVAAAIFFSLALLLSTTFNDIWRPLLIACGVSMALSLYEQAARDRFPYGVFRLMSGEEYFRTGQLPWMSLLLGAAASGAMLFVAAKNLERQDF